VTSTLGPSLTGLAEVPHLTSDVHDADEAQRLAVLPESRVVLGGGYVAVELAQLFARLGSRVTIVARSALLRGYEPELGRTLGEMFAGEGIEVVSGARIDHVRGDASGVELVLETADGGSHVRGMFVVGPQGSTTRRYWMRSGRAAGSVASRTPTSHGASTALSPEPGGAACAVPLDRRTALLDLMTPPALDQSDREPLA
jgi:hypothetical protein